MSEFKPSYTWPGAVPFRLFYESEKIRVFIIENVQHNWNWLSECAEDFRPSDYFMVIGGWYQSESFAQEANLIFNILNLRRKNFYFMFNSKRELANFEPFGFVGEIINQNAWLKEKQFGLLEAQKSFDAIYIGRRTAFKRHMLAEKVRRLAIVAGDNHGNASSPVPPHAWLNPIKLGQQEIKEKINEAHCGLILSAVEGACFSSSEYLLCGIPVVSTQSLGGRDVWYNEYNSIVADDNPDAIAAAVDVFLANPRDPEKIIKMHIDQSEVFRKRFVHAFDDMLKRHGDTAVDPNAYFRMNFTPKMRGGMWHQDIVRLFKTK